LLLSSTNKTLTIALRNSHPAKLARCSNPAGHF
jgi:hypothetical protein